jgi:hypothetical protein
MVMLVSPAVDNGRRDADLNAKSRKSAAQTVAAAPAFA